MEKPNETHEIKILKFIQENEKHVQECLKDLLRYDRTQEILDMIDDIFNLIPKGTGIYIEHMSFLCELQRIFSRLSSIKLFSKEGKESCIKISFEKYE